MWKCFVLRAQETDDEAQPHVVPHRWAPGCSFARSHAVRHQCRYGNRHRRAPGASGTDVPLHYSRSPVPKWMLRVLCFHFCTVGVITVYLLFCIRVVRILLFAAEECCCDEVITGFVKSRLEIRCCERTPAMVSVNSPDYVRYYILV